MIQALSYYVTNVYPEALELCKSLDVLSKQILRGEPCNSLDSAILERLDLYKQKQEKERFVFGDDWEMPNASVQLKF